MEEYARQMASGVIGGGISATTVYAGQASVQAPPTLVRALGSLEELNKRLRNANGQLLEIAQAVGGPFPSGNPRTETPGRVSAMGKLCEGVQEAHMTVGEIEQALSAVRRSLGA